MIITIVGTGYVGLVSGSCLAESGHEIICADISEEKIAMLNEGKIPIYEPGLEEIVKRNVQEKRLTFTTDVAGAIQKASVVFSAVGTPMGEFHEADLKYVKAVAKTFAENLNGYKIFVNKSTVPVGTADMVKEVVKEITGADFGVVSNPEFLKEGAAVKDFLNPDRIVIGTETEQAKELMRKVYAPFERAQSPIMHTDIRSAELIKYAANAFLATKISFINEVSRYCDKVGADVNAVAKGMGYDKRIGPRFLHAGVGYGGSCFPKDVKAIIQSAKKEGMEFQILEAVDKVNDEQKEILFTKLKELVPDLNGKKICIWGLSFKPRTDDIREAPAIKLAYKLKQEGANVKAFDPVSIDNTKQFHPDLDIEYGTDKYNAADGADAIILVTEWDEFRVIDFDKLREHMPGRILIDARNIYDGNELREEGFEYRGIGRR